MTVSIYGLDRPAAFRLESFMVHNDIDYRREPDTDNLYNMTSIQLKSGVFISILENDDVVFYKYKDKDDISVSVTIHSSDFYKISIL